MPGSNFLVMGDEATFNTMASSFRGVRTADDSFESRTFASEVGGIAEGDTGDMLEGFRQSDRGGVHTVKPYLTSNGLGFLFRALFPNAAITTPMGATDARQMVFSTGAAASSRSLSVVVGREDETGAVTVDGYTGGQATNAKFGQALSAASGSGDNDKATFELTADYVNHPRPTSAPGSRPYPSILSSFVAEDCTLSIGADLESLESACLNKFGLMIDTAIDVSPTCIGPSWREKARRGGQEKITLDLGWRYKGRDYFDAWLNGTPLAFQAKWEDTTVEIEEGIHPSLTIDVACFTFNGKDPVSAAAAATEQDLPGIVRNNAVDPKVTVTLITSDTAY